MKWLNDPIWRSVTRLNLARTEQTSNSQTRPPRTSHAAAVLLLGVLIVAQPRTSSPLLAVEPQLPAEQWHVMYIGENRIGYGQTTTQNVTVNKQPLVQTVQTSEMQFKRFGQDIKLSVRLTTHDTETGDMRSFDLTFGDSPKRMVKATGKVERGRLIVETTVGGRTTRSSKVWTPDMRSPAYEFQLYRTSVRRRGDVARFKMYRPEENRVVSAVVSADGMRPTRLFDQSQKQLLRTRTVMADLPTVTSYIDSAGNVAKTEVDFFGQRLVTYTVDRQEALKAISGGELDQAVQSLISTDPIRDPHHQQELTYKITLSGTDLAKLLPSGPTQTVRIIDPHTVLVTVRATKPVAGANKLPSPTQDYLSSNRYLQIRDPHIIQHARRAAGTQVDPWKICLAMERYVFQKLTAKNFSTALATAADVAQNLEGDCTEHAVLLAAMVRTRKIPSRLVGGLVYLERNRFAYFGGHMWTEVFVNGRWIPMDATLGLGGIGVGHIKLATSSFADDAPIPVTLFLPLMRLIGHMKIQVTASN